MSHFPINQMQHTNGTILISIGLHLENPEMKKTLFAFSLPKSLKNLRFHTNEMKVKHINMHCLFKQCQMSGSLSVCKYNGAQLLTFSKV